MQIPQMKNPIYLSFYYSFQHPISHISRISHLNHFCMLLCDQTYSILYTDILIPKITSILFGKYSVFTLAHSALSLLLLPSVMDHKGPQYSDTCIGMICYFATNSIRYDSPKILVITLGSHIERFAFRAARVSLKKMTRINRFCPLYLNCLLFLIKIYLFFEIII